MIPLRLKGGVSLSGMRPQLVFAVLVAKDIWDQLGAPEFVVTSVNDGHHSLTSLHYAGCGADLRSRNIPTEDRKHDAVSKLKKSLGQDFDVLLEDLNGPNEHIHIEYQPRRK